MVLDEQVVLTCLLTMAKGAKARVDSGRPSLKTLHWMSERSCTERQQHIVGLGQGCAAGVSFPCTLFAESSVGLCIPGAGILLSSNRIPPRDAASSVKCVGEVSIVGRRSVLLAS